MIPGFGGPNVVEAEAVTPLAPESRGFRSAVPVDAGLIGGLAGEVAGMLGAQASTVEAIEAEVAGLLGSAALGGFMALVRQNPGALLGALGARQVLRVVRDRARRPAVVNGVAVAVVAPPNVVETKEGEHGSE